jgi:hypothetical protein
MLGKVFDVFFGCWHTNYSFPITAKASRRRTEAAALTGTYVVCLDCGKELPYDWQSMKIVTASPSTAASLEGTRKLAPKQAA